MAAMDDRSGAIEIASDAGEMHRVVVGGDWTIGHGRALQKQIASALTALAGSREVMIDIGAVERLDTAGGWLLTRLGHELRDDGARVVFTSVAPKYRDLIEELSAKEPADLAQGKRQNRFVAWLERLGASVQQIGNDVVRGITFLGAVVIALGGWVMRPWHGRWISVIHQMDRSGVQAIPIIALMSVLIGGIIAQQGIFQLKQFGADSLAVDLVAIIVLRELGVLLTAIMVAGRSGSAYTAEIGSMKMREEIDALRVIGLEPVEVLVLPRVIALILVLPVLTFISDISALVGAGFVSWTYAGMPPTAFIERVREAIGLNTYLVGLIKAPAMALIIGLISTVEGLAVRGSSESLGLHTTASVVKAIFMVIVVDGIFAIFFATIGY